MICSLVLKILTFQLCRYLSLVLQEMNFPSCFVQRVRGERCCGAEAPRFAGGTAPACRVKLELSAKVRGTTEWDFNVSNQRNRRKSSHKH